MPPTATLIAFVIFSTAALLLGHASRVRGWLREEVSRTVHFHTIVWLWTATFVFSVWRLPVDLTGLWLIAIELLLVGGVGLAAIPIARLIGCDNKQTGVMAVACAVANIGITLGAFVCYCLVEPATDARAYAMTMTAVMQVAAILIMYPVCRHFGELGDRRVSTLKLIGMTFTDVRSLPLLGTTIGLVLALTRTPFPDAVESWHVVTVLFFTGCFSTYFGIGMRLHFGDAFRYVRQQVLLAVMRFGVSPLVVLAVITLSGWTMLPIEGSLRDVLMIQAAMPTAVMTVMLSNLFHLDVRLACMLWLWNTLLYLVLILPIVVFVMG